MKESFLYYLWENRLLTGTLETTSGLPVEIVNPGFRNTNSGPDYLEAKVRIGGQLWIGHVEIHVKTSDWNRHGHQYDKAYRNVILHAVYEHDTTANSIPVLELNGHFNAALYNHYETILASRQWIACERQMNRVMPFTINTWLERMSIERLQEKSKFTEKLLVANKFDWEDALYRQLLRYLGMKVNNEAFETLASLLPFKTLMKHADQLTQLEAMLLGCAGFLNLKSYDDYPRLLQREFAMLRTKFDLIAMPVERWKFMRMRPANFPTVRLAQMAQLIHQQGCLFSKVKEAATVNEAKTLFDVQAGSYWDTHYRFSEGTSDESPTEMPKRLGESTANVLIINAVAPLLFCYGRFHHDQSYCEKALGFLEDTPAEDNAILRHFAAIGTTASNAMQSQALLHLYNHYCRQKRCLECNIGNFLLQDNDY